MQSIQRLNIAVLLFCHEPTDTFKKLGYSLEAASSITGSQRVFKGRGVKEEEEAKGGGERSLRSVKLEK